MPALQLLGEIRHEVHDHEVVFQLEVFFQKVCDRQMAVILEGLVRVHAGGQLLAELQQSLLVGELPLGHGLSASCLSDMGCRVISIKPLARASLTTSWKLCLKFPWMEERDALSSFIAQCMARNDNCSPGKLTR